MNRNLLTLLVILHLSISSHGQSISTALWSSSCVKYHITSLTVAGLTDIEAAVVNEESDGPFDNTTWGGVIMNWIATLFLWFIYLTLLVMALVTTGWFITAKGFWSWVVAFIGAFSYAMLAGRYLGYTTCLIFFIILFTALKLLFITTWGIRLLSFLTKAPAGKNSSRLNLKLKKIFGEPRK